VNLSRLALSTLAYLDLTCVTIAVVLWYLVPDLGALPVIIALAPCIIRLVITGHLPARTPFDMPLLVFLITAGISVWTAYDLETAWSKFWMIVGGILLYYGFANAILADPATMPRRLAWFLAVLGIATALYFIATNNWKQYPGDFAGFVAIGHQLQARLPSLPGQPLHPNVVGGILAVLVPFVVVVLFDFNKRVDASGSSLVKMGIRLFLLAVLLFGLLMSSSRGAWVGLAVATVLAFWGYLSVSFTQSRPRLYGWLFLGGLVVQTMVFVFLASSQVENLSNAPVLNSVSSHHYDVIDSRLGLYRNSLILVLDYAFTGAGLGGFSMLYSTYSLLIHVDYSAYSHNLFLDIAIQQGLFALLALLSTWAFVARQTWRGVGLDRWRGAALIAMVVIAVHGLTDDAIYGSGAVLLLFLPLAFFVGEAQTASGQPTATPAPWFRRHRFAAIAMGVLAFVVMLLYKPLLSQWYSNLGAVEQSRIELGTYTWPEWPLQDELRRQLDISQAVEYYERALALNPRNASANRRLGQIELSLGEYEDALNHLTVAYEMTPWDNATRQLLGEAYLVNGRLAEGRALWSTLETTRKQLEIRAYWYEYIGDTQRLSWIQSSLTP
jgi:tetratricopeptide (TPR) repeat protein